MPARLHALLLEQAHHSPDAHAYVSGVRETTKATSYAELGARAARLAAGLSRAGIEVGDRVALVLGPSVEHVAAQYALLMAGAAAVPLNPDTRPHVLRHALSHARVRGVIIGAGEARHLAPVATELPDLRFAVRLGDRPVDLGAIEVLDYDDLTESSDELRDSGASNDDLAVVAYTSGTTGKPKGVMLSHRNLVANVRAIVAYLGLEATDRAAMVLPYFYAYGSSVLHTHLAAGAAIVETGSIAFPATVLESIEHHRCTGLAGVPSTFARLLRVDDLASRDLSSLRYVTQAGAPMSRALTETLRRALPRARLYVMYGQTEAAARLSYLPPERLDDKPGSVGIAIPGVELAVVDEDGHEKPLGEVGEVVARGDNVMLGYLDDPEATARALRGGVLHTSDLGYMDDEGFLFLVGRASDMIKSAGHRIGPHEIEEVIAELDGVAECAVAGVPDELLGQAVVAFIVPAPGATLDEREVKARCFERLPRYAAPAHVRFVDEIPRSDRGKVLRAELVKGF